MRFFLILLFILPFLSIAQSTADLSKFKIDSGYFKSFDGSKIYYEVRGEGEPVVLVHGFIVNSESWKRTALYSDLLSVGYKVITFDMRGNGKSDKPHKSEAYAKDAETKDIMGLLNKLKIKKYKAVGYSRGSIILSRLLVMDNRVTMAVLGGMGADFINPEWPRRIMFYEALMGKDVEELREMKKYAREAKLDTVALAYLQKEQPSTSAAQLKSIDKKVLVIKGDQDTNNGSGEELAALIPKASFVKVPGVHDDANKSSEFSQTVIGFFKKSEAMLKK